MNAWGITDTGTVRKQNQDAFCVEQLGERGVLLVVCDGMGGARAGNIASQLATELFVGAVTADLNSGEDFTPEQILTRAVAKANESVFLRSESDSTCYGMGTTLVSALVLDGKGYIANVGDSRAYAVSDSGIRRITRDHSLVADLVARGEITPEQARQHPQKNLITRALGAEPQLRADLFELPCVPGEFLLLCSDGLSNVVTDQEILYEILHGGEADGCCRRLLDVALLRGAPDNVTAVLLQM